MKQLIDAASGQRLLLSVETADSFWTRFRGLQFRRQLPIDSGIVLTPCSSLHTCFMRFPIDVIMLDDEQLVLEHRRNIQPWRFVFCPKRTSSVIETRVDAVVDLTGKHVAWRKTK
ncbi:MAG: DUF192 domain-containing protein [Rubripirellula sp.]|nr:hypothetical protein [Rhodopirellula sp.]MCH1438827.1 DUF192 domain-containing protein [Rubripirellula sp.]OUX08102.1 MAG: hypothetical protein CBE00_02770 [Planctomycetaceae bacterium TMED240]